jgi:hypothetical protein
MVVSARDVTTTLVAVLVPLAQQFHSARDLGLIVPVYISGTTKPVQPQFASG